MHLFCEKRVYSEGVRLLEELLPSQMMVRLLQ